MPAEPHDRARRALTSAVRTGRISLEPQVCAPSEILERLSLAERHLAEAIHLGTQGHPILASPYDRAYDACVVAATAMVQACGFRSRSDSGHQRALLGAQLLFRELGHSDESRLIDELKTRVRPVRHASVYTALDAVTPSSLRRLLDIAAGLVPLMAREAAAFVGIADRAPTDWSSLFPVTGRSPTDLELDR
jgi:hypothetical protein